MTIELGEKLHNKLMHQKTSKLLLFILKAHTIYIYIYIKVKCYPKFVYVINWLIICWNFQKYFNFKEKENGQLKH